MEKNLIKTELTSSVMLMRIESRGDNAIFKEDNFEKMLTELIKEEEEKLAVNGEEFQRRHLEIMELLEKISGKK